MAGVVGVVLLCGSGGRREAESATSSRHDGLAADSCASWRQPHHPTRFLHLLHLALCSISFNFGLHNLDNSSAAEALYTQQLTAITERLMATGAKLAYVLTTPYMPDRYFGNMVVEQLNTIATGLMQARGIPVIDLYSRVTAFCGAVYKNCR